MIKKTTSCLTVLLLSLTTTSLFAQGTVSIPKLEDAPHTFNQVKVNADGSMKMSGTIQPVHDNGRAVMVAELPKDRVKQECWFFGGDSLNGFDYESARNQAFIEGDKMYMEFRAFMLRTQAAYVKKKYHIKSIPHIDNQNQRYSPPNTVQASCNNADFETGDFTGWVGASGDNTNSNAFMNAYGTAYYNINQNIYDCADLQMISSAYGNDPAGGFPGKDPNGGNWSARIGGAYINEAWWYTPGCATGPRPWGMYWNQTAPANAEYIRQTFTVSASNALVSFDYAVVLNDGGHPNGQQPYFHVYVTNSSGVVLNATCTEYYVQAPAGSPPPGFTLSSLTNTYDGSAMYYQSWKSGSINLTPYIGQSVNLYFIASGCTNGGHCAWAYIDATCGQADIDVANTQPCTGTTTTFTAPPVYGGSYSWSGPGIVGPTNGQVITVNASGTYTCVVTPPQGAACSYTLTQSVTFITSPTVGPTASPATLCSGNSTTLNANATNATSYSWSPGGSTSSSVVVTPPTGTTIYTVTVTNGGNCPRTGTVSVNVTATPVVTVSSNTNICSGTSTTLSGTVTPGTYSWQPSGSTSSSISVNPVSQTSYTLIGTNGTCTNSAVVTVSVTPTPTLTISGTTTLCSGGSTVLTGATASNYSWSTGATTNTISVSPPTGTTTYTLTGTNGSCSATKTVSVVVTATPTLTISGTTTLCSGGSTVLTGATASTYSWSTGATTNTISVSPPTGTTTYTLTGNNGSCTATRTVSVVVTATPTMSISGTNTLCSGGSVVLTGATASNYTWQPGGVTTSTISVSPPTGTTTYTLTGANGTCTASTTASVTVTATPTLNISGTTNLCSGQSTVLTGATASSYSWSTGATTNTISVTPPVGTTTYTLTGSNGACSVTRTVSVVVTATPTLNISGTTNLCSGQSTVLTGATASNYTWSPGGATTSTISVTPPTGTTTYTLTGANGTCTASTTASVSVTATPTLNITGTTNLCSGQSTTLTGATASGYTWSTGATTNTISVTPPVGSTTYTLSGANGACTATASVAVNVTTTPTVNISGASPICSGSSVVLTGATASNYTWLPGGATTSTISVSPGTTTTYTLTGANGTCTANAVATVSVTPTPTMSISGAAPICSGSSINLNGGTATNYTWSSGGNGASTTVTPTVTTTYTLTGANGTCTAQAVATVSVTPTPTVSIAGGGSICSGQTVVLNGGTANNYTWSPTGGSASSATVTPGTTTTYTLTGANGTCTASAVTTVTVTPTPTVSISGAAAICNGGGVTLSGGTANSYTWSPGSQNTGTISVTPGTTTTYTLTGANGTCTANAVATVTVNPLPVIGTASITAAPCGQSTGCINSVNVSGGTPTYTYSWNGGAGSTSSTNCNIPAGTYVLVVTDANGCQATQNFSVPSASGPNPPAVAATTTVACIGDQVVVSINPVTPGIVYTWTDNTGTHTGSTYTITNIGPSGSYPISVTATDNNGCVSSATNLNITVNPLPVINTSASPGTICVGQNTTLNASGATSYTWSSGGTAATETVAPTTNTTYTVTGSTSGCVSTQTVAVTVNPLPVVTAVASPTTICAGQSTVLTAGGANTYTWSTSAQTSTISVSPTSSATYTVTGDIAGCTSTQTVQVNVIPLPVITASPAPASICVGQTTTITAGGATSYTWSTNAGGGSATTVTVSPSTTTTYTLAGTQNGCSDSTTVTVSIGVPPTITVAQSSTVMCSGGTTTLTCSGATNYTWMPGSIPGGTVVVSPTSNTVYTVSATAGGCPSTETVSVNVTPTPTISATVSGANICSGTTTTLSASGSVNYTWSPGGATTATITVTPTVTTTYTVVSDSAGCSSSQQVTVNVTTTPTVSAVSSQTTICSTQSTTLTASGATTYTWNPGGTGTSIVVSPASNQTYTVTGANGNCTDVTTINVNVTPTPTVTINASSPAVCAGQTATLTASGATSYTWSTGATTGTTTDTPSGTTTYTVTGDNAGCTSMQQVTVQVNPLPTLAPVGNQTACAGGQINTINYSAGGATVNWTNTNPNVGIAGSGSGDINGYTAPNVTTQEVGVITATPTDAGTGCVGASQSYTVVINPTPQVSGGVVDSALCGLSNGGVSGINVSGGTPTYTYQWYNNGVLMPGETNPTLSNVGMGSYSVQITDANGCVAQGGTTTFTVNGSVAVVAGFSANVYTGQAPLTVTFTNTTTGASSYNWQFGNGTSNQQNPGTQYTSMGTYTVILTAYNGSCMDTAMAIIVVDAATSIVIPNIYSPNGDGTNDVFMIQCTGMRTLKCDIFNRWGQLVYTLTGPNDVWDGTMNNGNPASEGTYYYILDADGFDNQHYRREGHLTLVK